MTPYAKAMLLGVAGSALALNVADVFSVDLYTGNGSNRSIVNGVNLATRGGLVWGKNRSASADHWLYDTLRGDEKPLASNTTSAEADNSTANFGVTGFNADGFNIGGGDAGAKWNTAANNYWTATFRRAKKFFDVVTYTGTGVARTIAHSLGVVPGMILVKAYGNMGSLGGASDWQVYHVSTGNTNRLVLNSTGAAVDVADACWNATTPTDSVFSLGTNSNVNSNGVEYVAYLFAHDTSATGIIQCGSYTGNGSSTGPTVSLGWQPQFLLTKRSSGGTSDWIMFDSTRGMGSGGDKQLFANLSNAEDTADFISVSSTGFAPTTTSGEINANGSEYVYLAIKEAA